MYKYSLPIIPDSDELPRYTMSTTIIHDESRWLTTTEILNELKVRNIPMTRPTLLRKGHSGEIEMRPDPVNQKKTFFNLTEVLEKFS